MNFGEKLKLLREKKHLTQNDLAKLLNVSKANISRYELGIRQPSIETIIRIAKFFNVSIDWLFGRSTIMSFSSVNGKPRDFDSVDLEILEFIKEDEDVYQMFKEVKSASNIKVKLICDIWKQINESLK